MDLPEQLKTLIHLYLCSVVFIFTIADLFICSHFIIDCLLVFIFFLIYLSYASDFCLCKFSLGYTFLFMFFSNKN